MQPIISIKDGILWNLATIALFLGLGALAIWVDHRSHGEVSIVVWIFSGIFVLFCYFPINSIRRPKSRMLAIEGDDLVWRIHSKEPGDCREERIPLRSVQTLEVVIAQEDGHSEISPEVKLYFITSQQNKRELPSEFFPGVYRKRIVAAIRQRIPDLRVVEKKRDN